MFVPKITIYDKTRAMKESSRYQSSRLPCKLVYLIRFLQDVEQAFESFFWKRLTLLGVVKRTYRISGNKSLSRHEPLIAEQLLLALVVSYIFDETFKLYVENI